VRVVAILNQKGGVGKTTTAVNLGAALALRGRSVLLIDADPQGNLTDHLGLDEKLGDVTVYDVLTDNAPIQSAVLETETPGLFVLPTDGDLAAVEQELATEIARETRMRRALAGIPEGTYDWVFIDCPPSLGLLSLNAMTAATGLLVTVQTEYFAMRGLGQLDEIVGMVQEHVNPQLELLGILPTLVSPVTRLAREVIAEIREAYGDLVFQTRIRQNVRLAEAPGHQVHIFAYDPLSAGAVDYRALAAEIEARVAAAAVATPVEAVPVDPMPAEAEPVEAVPAEAPPVQAAPAEAVPATEEAAPAPEPREAPPQNGHAETPADDAAETQDADADADADAPMAQPVAPAPSEPPHE